MPTSAGRGVSTDRNNVPTGGIFMLGVAHHRCVDAAFCRIMAGELAFAYPLAEVVADDPGELPPLHLPSGPEDCLFCDRPDRARLTDEHVWSEWFQKELIALMGRFPSYGPGRETSPLGPTVPVCGTCNNRWMSVLENDAKPLIVDMWRHPRLLQPPDQELLATWATKTAIVFDAIGEATIPRHFGHELRVSRRPSAGVWVWATMVAGPPPGLAAWLRPLGLAAKGEHPPDQPNGVCVTFTVHRVAFQVLFTVYRGRYDAALRHHVASQLTPLWPLDGTSRSWPPGGFDLEALEDVAESPTVNPSSPIALRPPAAPRPSKAC
jgi:hypothetical protein